MQKGKTRRPRLADAKPEPAHFLLMSSNEEIEISEEDLKEFAEEMSTLTGNLNDFVGEFRLIIDKYLRNYNNTVGSADDLSKEYKILELVHYFFEEVISDSK